MVSASKIQSRSIDDLPEWIAEDIFQRLPITTLGRCMCVKKQRCFLIKNPKFIATNAITKRRSNQYSICRLWHFDMYTDNDRFEFHRSLDLPSDWRVHKNNDAALASCNGLICGVRKVLGDIMLWNPVIKKILTLPVSPSFAEHGDKWPSSTQSLYLGFAFDSLTDDYKLAAMYQNVTDRTRAVVDVFSFKSYSWNLVTQDIPWYIIYEHSLPILNGALHWVGRDCWRRAVIVAFNVNTEVFTEIELPEGLSHTLSTLMLGAYKHSSIVCCHQSYDGGKAFVEVWIMKEYGQAESWSKISTFNRANHSLPGCGEYLLGIRYTGEVLWKKRQTFSTDLVSGENKSVNFPDEVSGHFNNCLRHFEESLMLLDNDNAVSYYTDEAILE